MIRLAISADCHVSEPTDLWSENLPACLRRRGPRAEVRDGHLCLVVEERVVRRLARAPEGTPDAAPASLWGWGESGREGRIRDLDRDGVWAEVIYPNLAFFTAYAIEDPALQVAVCGVYNDWVGETFGSGERFAPVGILPASDVAACVGELERFGSRGLRAGLLPAHADRRTYNDRAWEPLWEAAAGVGVPLSFHAGTGRSQTPAHGEGAAVVNYVVTLSALQETVSYLCASGILERHPALRVVMVECGAGWLAWTLDAMDDAYRDHHAFVRPRLRELPSAYFRRQGAVTFQRDPVGIANVSRTGARCLLWGSDYPHPEGTFPASREALEEQFRGVAQEVTDRVLWRNATELYGIPLPHRMAREAQA